MLPHLALLADLNREIWIGLHRILPYGPRYTVNGDMVKEGALFQMSEMY